MSGLGDYLSTVGGVQKLHPDPDEEPPSLWPLVLALLVGVLGLVGMVMGR